MPGVVSQRRGAPWEIRGGRHLAEKAVRLSSKPPESGRHSAVMFEGRLGAGLHAGPGNLDDPGQLLSDTRGSAVGS